MIKEIKIKTMKNNGYHITEVWESILFQLYYTLLIMIIEYLYIITTASTYYLLELLLALVRK